MFKMKHLGVAAAIVLVAAGAMASNFRVADQVYLPIAGHVQGGGSLFVSDVWISNLSTDPVSVSLIYGPQNGKGAYQSFPNKIALAPNERKEFVDFFNTVLPEIANPFGLVVFNGCKANQDCKPDPVTSLNANFRPISVESRIYAIDPTATPATAKSNGQDMPGIPWYNFVSSTESAAQVDKVFITGIRVTAGYRSNLGVLNASQFSSTTLVATLKDGATGNPVGVQHVFNLPPLTFEQPSVAAAFTPQGGTPISGTNLYVEVSQGISVPVVGGPDDAVANGCNDGCPAFLTWGSQLDNQSSDPTTLEAQYPVALNDVQIGCIYSPLDYTCVKSGKTGAKNIRRAVNH